MFGLGMPEILLILAIALIVIGPKKLPDLAKTLGRAMGEFKRSAQDFKRSIDVETTVKDITDLDESKSDLKDVLKDANKNQNEPVEEFTRPAHKENDSPSKKQESASATSEADDAEKSEEMKND